MKSEIDTNTFRVDRGGSWYSVARFARAAFRDWVAPGSRYENFCFRLINENPGLRLLRTVKIDKQVERWVRLVWPVYFGGDAPILRYSGLGFRLVRTVKVDKQIKRWREESEEELFSDE